MLFEMVICCIQWYINLFIKYINGQLEKSILGQQYNIPNGGSNCYGNGIFELFSRQDVPINGSLNKKW